MELRKLNLTNKKEILFIENLYTEAFPPEERREISIMLDLYKENPDKFSLLLVVKGDEYIGFFNYWDLEDFYFVEHFAISPDFRSGGYGSKVINLFLENAHKPIVLEVEPPVTDLAERRIGFYSRLGFTLLDEVEYEQPSYTGDGKMYPMKLMSYGSLDFTNNRQDIILLIHTVAYKR